MTKSDNWLEYRAKATGKTVDEIRQDMRDLSKLAVEKRGKNHGFAKLSKEKRKEIAQKGYEAGLGKKNEADDSGQTSNS
jgi:hypothetical protein